MKILNTKNGKFSRFVKKNGAFLVLGVCVLAACVAVFALTLGGRGTLIKNSSEINLSGDDSNWISSSDKVAQTDTPSQSLQQSSQQAQSSSSSKGSNSSGSQQVQSSSGASERVLLLLPLKGEVVNKYSGGKPVKSKTMGDWRLHTGVDIAADKGTSVRAAGIGRVSKVYTDSMWGTTVEIEHSGGLTTIYSSLADDVYVKKGQDVESGQIIGKVGNTAKIEISEVSHLHFAVKKDGEFIDPEKAITKPIGE